MYKGYKPFRAPRKTIRNNTSIDDSAVAQLLFKEITEVSCSKSSGEL